MSNHLHPTAIIDPAAQLGNDVTIGPYAVIEGPATIGDRTTIQAHAVISGRVTMGVENVIGYGAIIGAEPQDLAFRPEVESEVRIGDGNRIREYCTIHRGTSSGSVTVVGSQCFLMAGAHLAHNVRLGDRVILANNTLLGGYVNVDDRVFVGGGCVFHQHIRIGRLAICQGGSMFSKNIPPFVIAAERNGIAGLNAVGLRRADMTPAARVEIKAAFDLLYRSGKNVSQAIAAAQDRIWGEEGQAFWAFVADAGRRGLCDLIATRHGGVEEEEEQ
ncbi:MAG: Acyl-[acyl-carrier-protein]--UDP-N-acetylglucosamine O-acyltransferase [Chthoniobacter sp.]|nr:Acyl-[acyl-carrier-protein]--UDP-N-acetylglucosamine O-acyltransferase [Chthoniobacter sp.]